MAKEEQKEIWDMNAEDLDVDVNLFDDDFSLDELTNKKSGEEEKEEEEDKKDKPKKSEEEEVEGGNLFDEDEYEEEEEEEEEENDEDEDNEDEKEEIEELVEKKFKQYLQEVPEENKLLVEHLLSGGSVEDFAKGKEIPEVLDLQNKEQVEKIARMFIKGDDPDLVDAQIEALKKKGTLAEFAKNKHDKHIEEKEAKRLEKLEESSKRRKTSINKERDLVNKLESDAKEFKDHEFIKIENPKEMAGYMGRRKVELEGGGSITEFQRDISELVQNKNTSFILASVVKMMKEDGGKFTELKKKISESIEEKIEKGINKDKKFKKKSEVNNKKTTDDILGSFGT